MPNKQAILENVDMYSADELVKFIKEGIVTFEELCDETDGYFSASVRKEVEKKLAGSEEDDWQIAKASNSIETLMQYLSTYANSIHRAEALKLVNELKNNQAKVQAETGWESVDKNNIDSLRAFCKDYPDDVHCKEARKLINILVTQTTAPQGDWVKVLKGKLKDILESEKELNKNKLVLDTVIDFSDKQRLSHSELLGIISTDHNLFSSEILNSLCYEGYLTYDDLRTIKINEKFIEALQAKKRPQDFALSPRKLERINKLSTEVYFWGIPSSGKSCALGAILSVANNGKIAKTMSPDPDCVGYGYMQGLRSLFTAGGEVCLLPGKTHTVATYEMAFDLVGQDDKSHPITCMDFSGELIKAMFKSDAGISLDMDELNALDTLTKVLVDPKTRTKNKKIHFFVMEYGAENKLYDGYTQQVYLDGALQYIKRTGIFKDDTVAIYIIITKADKANASQGQLEAVLKKYISDNYDSFYNGLVKICKDNEINNGMVEIIPFTLGQVCFQDYCLFDERPATNIVRKLLDCTKGFKNDRFHRGINIFKQ